VEEADVRQQKLLGKRPWGTKKRQLKGVLERREQRSGGEEEEGNSRKKVDTKKSVDRGDLESWYLYRERTRRRGKRGGT